MGTGIRAARHTTAESRDAMVRAEKLFFLLADAVSERWVRGLNPTAESLFSCYILGGPRLRAYQRMIDRVLAPVRRGRKVCVAFYGHPGVFVYPSHEAIRQAKREGFEARMLPGISAEDCLFADLGIDPARSGCQSFEATDFLVHRRTFDPSSALLLWQVGMVGSLHYQRKYGGAGCRVLARYLARFYGSEHEVVLYEATQFPVFDPTIRTTTIARLPSAGVNGMMTLFIPPVSRRPDPRVLRQLGLPPSRLHVVPPCWDSGT